MDMGVFISRNRSNDQQSAFLDRNGVCFRMFNIETSCFETVPQLSGSLGFKAFVHALKQYICQSIETQKL